MSSEPGTDLIPFQLPDPTAIASMDDDGKFAVLETCEEVITRSSIYKGLALAVIKKHELYRVMNYRTWQDYLGERWPGLHRSYAHRLIQAAEAVKKLDASLQARGMLPIGNTVATIVRNEAQARDLRGHEHEVIRLVDEGKPLEKAVPEIVLKVRRDHEQQAEAQQAKRQLVATAPEPSTTVSPPTPPQRGSGAKSPLEVRELDPNWRAHLSGGVIMPNPAPDEDLTDLTVKLKLTVEEILDLPRSRAETLLRPFEADLLELLDVLGYEADADA